uniref:Uncharacterized protein n=1 Tax=Dunaliella tertiolecta TaxID=3047 RepID=A0A7S3QRG0_DUNTE
MERNRPLCRAAQPCSFEIFAGLCTCVRACARLRMHAGDRLSLKWMCATMKSPVGRRSGSMSLCLCVLFGSPFLEGICILDPERLQFYSLCACFHIMFVEI